MFLGIFIFLMCQISERSVLALKDNYDLFFTEGGEILSERRLKQCGCRGENIKRRYELSERARWCGKVFKEAKSKIKEGAKEMRQKTMNVFKIYTYEEKRPSAVIS